MLSDYDKNGDGKLDLIIADKDVHGKFDNLFDVKPL